MREVEELPEGWTLERIREVSGDSRAIVLSTDRSVSWVRSDHHREPIDPEIVIGLGELCVVKPVNDDDWYMGTLRDDGSVDCWSAYNDLGEALRGL